MAVTDLVRGALSGTQIRFASQVTGVYDYDPSAPAEPPGFNHWVMSALVKPAVYVNGPGGQLVAYEPYGRPEHDYRLIFGLLVVAAGAGVVWAAKEWGRRSAKGGRRGRRR